MLLWLTHKNLLQPSNHLPEIFCLQFELDESKFITNFLLIFQMLPFYISGHFRRDTFLHLVMLNQYEITGDFFWPSIIVLVMSAEPRLFLQLYLRAHFSIGFIALALLELLN